MKGLTLFLKLGWYTRMMVLLLTLAATGYVQASCNGTTGVMSFNVGTISIPSSNVLYTYYYGGTNVVPQNVVVNADLNCSMGYTLSGHIHNPVENTNDLEKLMLSDGQWSGLGIKFYNNSISSGWWSSFKMLSPPNSAKGQGNWNKYCFTATCWNHSGDTSVVQSGNMEIRGGGVPVKSGPFNMQITGVYTADGYDAMDFIISGTIVAPTCDISANTPSSVDLPPITASYLSHNGAYGPNVNFSIVLNNCNDSPNISMMLTDAATDGIAEEGVLANQTGSDMAENVGVQLLAMQNGDPTPKNVTLGQQFNVGHASDTQFTIPMAARYYRTSDKAIKGGSVSASVIYQLYYQ